MNLKNKRRLWGRRGFILGEFTLKTVIAVLCILLLVLLLVNLYATFSQKTKIEQAAGSVKKLLEGATIATQTGTYRYVLTEPKGWAVIFYDKGLGSAAFCGEQCLCICKQPKFYNFKSQLDFCASAGSCANSAGKLHVPAKIVIDGPTEIVLTKEDTLIVLTKK